METKEIEPKEPAVESRLTRSTTRGWIVSIVAAILLSAAATWFLGNLFRQGTAHAIEGGAREGSASTGCRMKCCGNE